MSQYKFGLVAVVLTSGFVLTVSGCSKEQDGDTDAGAGTEASTRGTEGGADDASPTTSAATTEGATTEGATTEGAATEGTTTDATSGDTTGEETPDPTGDPEVCELDMPEQPECVMAGQQSGSQVRIRSSATLLHGGFQREIAQPVDVQEDSHEEGGFILPPDDEDVIECDAFAQDCPEGEKCMPWANDGGNSWNALRCSPLAPDPRQVGESCTVEGSGVSGIDDCARGAMCWGVDPETNEGTCIELCGCSAETPTCDSAAVCNISNQGALPICLPVCNPLEPNACPDGQGCYPGGENYFCVPSAAGSQGGQGQPCESINACSPGHVCELAELVPGCTAALCCTALCDVTEAGACAGGLDCVARYEAGTAPTCLEDVGICSAP